MAQEGDVLLFQTLDDGDINVVDGVVEMTDDLRTAILLSMFGGNENDNGQDVAANWWGNLAETEPSKTYRSETQFLTNSLPANSFNRTRVEDAAVRDLQWMLDDGVAIAIDVTVVLPGSNLYRIFGVVETETKSTAFDVEVNGGPTQ